MQATGQFSARCLGSRRGLGRCDLLPCWRVVKLLTTRTRMVRLAVSVVYTCASATLVGEVLFQMHTPRIVNTNQNTYLKVDVKSDGTEPAIDVIFVDGHRLLMKTKHLSTVEILDRLWEFCDAKDPKKGEAPALQTKAGKTKRR
ncbi:large ribosomal subunit protein mL53-like isoform X1 [Babylonia areolata]|uniref:large ribosomal subunit protein mL53-like isoform X1 n=1 Tax=Babylonia areolata TaxID=304850 RepID=UPI003FD4E757